MAAFPPPRPELLALLQAAKDSPDEDAPRLILADWMEEHGASAADLGRAELLRVQCRLSRLSRDEPEAAALRQREKELLEQHRGAWHGPFQGHANSPRRGLDSVDYPIRPSGEALEDLVGTEFWAWVAVLSRPKIGVTTEDDLRALLASPCLPTVRALDLSHNRIDSRVAALLAASPAVAHLRQLNLGFNTELGDEGARALAGSSHLGLLLELDLSLTGIGPEGAAALAASPHLAGLTHLDLGANGLGAEGAAALAASPYLKQLTRLDVLECQIGGDGVRALANSPMLAHFTSLNLFYSALDDEAVADLCASPHLGPITHLILGSNAIGPDGAAALAATPRLANLTRLDLSSNRIGNQGAAALAASPHLSQLRFLDLGYNQIGAPGGRALAASPHLAGLYKLVLNYNRIGRRGGGELANSPYLTNLGKIGLEGCDFGAVARTQLERRFGKDALDLRIH